MAAGLTQKVGLDGNKAPFNVIAVTDGNGNYAAAHGSTDALGALVNPATKEGVAAIVNTLNAPAQDASIQVLGTSLASLLVALQDLDGKASTAANQTSQSTTLATILAALGPLSTDASVQAGTVKIEAVRALLAGTLNVSLATQPLPTGAATETTLTAIKNAMLAQASISESLWYDPTLTPVVYYFRQVINTDGVITYAWKNTDGTAATPNQTNIRPLGANSAIEVLQFPFDVIAPDTGTTAGQRLLRVVAMNLGVTPPAVAASFWINVDTGAAISAPTPANIKESTQNIAVTSSVLPTGAATSALQTTGNTSLAAIATQTAGLATAASQTTGNASLATIATQTAGLATAAAQTTGNTSLATLATASAAQSTAALQTTGNASLAALKTNSDTGLTNDSTALAAISATGTWQTNILTATAAAKPNAPNITLAGTLGAANAVLTLATGPNGTTGIKVAGTFVGTISAFDTIDGSTYDVPMTFRSFGPSSVSSATVTAAGFYFIETAGTQGLQLIMSSYTSGTATVSLVSTNALRSARVHAPVTDPAYFALSVGSAVLSSANPAFVAPGTGSIWSISAAVTTAAPTYTTGTSQALSLTTAGALRTDGSAVTQPVAPATGVTFGVAESGSSTASVGFTMVSAAGPGLVGKASAGNAYRATASNTSGVFGWLVIVNASAVPTSGTTIVPLDWAPLPALASGIPGWASLDEKPPIACTAGVVALMSTSLTTYTPSSLAGQISIAAR